MTRGTGGTPGTSQGAESVTLRARLYDLLEDPSPEWSRAAAALRGALALLIVASVTAAVLESGPLPSRWLRHAFQLFEVFVTLVFSAEYLVRLWICVEEPSGRYARPVLGRLRYAVTPLAIVDLIAVLPLYLGAASAGDLLVLRLFRIFRILKLARYSETLTMFRVVFMNERHALLSALGVMLVLLLVAASVLHLLEARLQPDAFGSIPAALWWAVVTLTTVGYGDVVPVTPLGRLVAGLLALIGIGMFALPTAILGAGFSRELQKRNFATTAALVARVPLFRRLDPARVAELVALLRPRELPAGYTVIRPGERGDALYFLVEGEVLARRGGRRHRLRAGAFFGEFALFDGRPRRVSVVTATNCQLLELRVSDFHRLLAGDPVFRRAVLEEARGRADMVAVLKSLGPEIAAEAEAGEPSGST